MSYTSFGAYFLAYANITFQATVAPAFPLYGYLSRGVFGFTTASAFGYTPAILGKWWSVINTVKPFSLAYSTPSIALVPLSAVKIVSILYPSFSNKSIISSTAILLNP